MAYDVVTTSEFDAHLNDAVAFRVECYGTRSARRLLDTIEAQMRLLSIHPLRGSLVDQDADNPDDEAYRWVRAESYIIVCHPAVKAGHVIFDKLFAASTNWRKRVMG